MLNKLNSKSSATSNVSSPRVVNHVSGWQMVLGQSMLFNVLLAKMLVAMLWNMSYVTSPLKSKHEIPLRIRRRSSQTDLQKDLSKTVLCVCGVGWGVCVRVPLCVCEI